MLLSQYLDGELSPADRADVRTHLRGCRGCRQEIDTLTRTVKTLGSLHADAPAGLADSIIAALRSEHPSSVGVPQHASRRRRDAPSLRVLPGAVQAQSSIGAAPRMRGWRALLRDCLRRSRLRVTLPIALLVGIALSLINQGTAILGGHITVAMCATCAADMLVCFLALNIGVLLVMRLPVRRRQL